MIIRFFHKPKRGRRSNTVNKAKGDFFKRHYRIGARDINLVKKSKHKFKHWGHYADPFNPHI